MEYLVVFFAFLYRPFNSFLFFGHGCKTCYFWRLMKKRLRKWVVWAVSKLPVLVLLDALPPVHTYITRWENERGFSEVGVVQWWEGGIHGRVFAILRRDGLHKATLAFGNSVLKFDIWPPKEEETFGYLGIVEHSHDAGNRILHVDSHVEDQKAPEQKG